MGEGELFHVFIEEDDEVGVAHRYERAIESTVFDGDGIIGCTAPIGSELLWGLQDGCPHIHRNALHLVFCVEIQFQHFDA